MATKDINTLIDFITQINNFNTGGDYIYAYRGHADKQKFKLNPKISRDNKNLKNEHIMLRDFIVSRPVEFIDCRYTIDYLAKMQHYGLPTRLLDLTLNPLVSLYFASCEFNGNDGNSMENGEVICFKIPKNEIKYYDGDTVSILANIAKLPYDISGYTIPSNCKKKGNCKGCSINPNDCDIRSKCFYSKRLNNESIHYLQHEINYEKSHFKEKINPFDINSVVCVKAKMDTPRIINQSGLFLLYGMGDKNKKMPVPKRSWIKNRLTIMSDKKNDIIHDLSKFNMTKTYIFPEMENIAKDIANQYSTSKGDNP
ncbi:hypothetical protein FACS1894106_0250 [Spirochaetia bacterium]|nr:hypothetical protein FACS1894106_0250 [Spirochaetia bacterium]